MRKWMLITGTIGSVVFTSLPFALEHLPNSDMSSLGFMIFMMFFIFPIAALGETIGITGYYWLLPLVAIQFGTLGALAHWTRNKMREENLEKWIPLFCGIGIFITILLFAFLFYWQETPPKYWFVGWHWQQWVELALLVTINIALTIFFATCTKTLWRKINP